MIVCLGWESSSVAVSPSRAGASKPGLAATPSGVASPRPFDSRYKTINRFVCLGWESNPHALRRPILSRVRIPIPPPKHIHL